MLKGIKGALKVLNSVDPEKREEVLRQLALKDPSLAEELRKKLISFEDIQKMSVKMLVEFTKEISLKDLGLGLRAASEELKSFILDNVSKSMQEEINFMLKGKPQPVSKVLEAQEKILRVFRNKVESGEIVLDNNPNDPLV